MAACDVIFDYIEDNCDIAVATILLGDFNVPHQPRCKRRYGKTTMACMFLFTECIIFIAWPRIIWYKNRNSRILDLVLISSDLKHSVKHCKDPLVAEDLHTHLC